MILHSDIYGETTAKAPVILLHGLFGRGRNLTTIARGLATGRNAVVLDLRNHGASPHAACMDYGTMAQDVLETLQALGIGMAAFIGHSMGGKTAMACALLAPEMVQRLLVADIAPVPYAHRNAAIAAAMQAIELRDGLTRAQADAALQAVAPDAAVRAFLLQNLHLGGARGGKPSWRIGLAEITGAIPALEAWPDFAGRFYSGPVLFVRGGRSDYVTEAGRQAARTVFPQARFLTLKDAGHWLHADQPAAFLAAAAHFLAA